MKTTIEIEIRPFNTSNEIDLSLANKLSNDIISRITKELGAVDTSKVYFEIKINTK